MPSSGGSGGTFAHNPTREPPRQVTSKAAVGGTDTGSSKRSATQPLSSRLVPGTLARASASPVAGSRNVTRSTPSGSAGRPKVATSRSSPRTVPEGLAKL